MTRIVLIWVRSRIVVVWIISARWSIRGWEGAAARGSIRISVRVSIRALGWVAIAILGMRLLVWRSVRSMNNTMGRVSDRKPLCMHLWRSSNWGYGIVTRGCHAN